MDKEVKSKRQPNSTPEESVPQAKIPEMSPREYEEFVSKLVATLDVCKTGVLYRNKKYPGVHQPGQYEIDISVEFTLGDLLFFLLIVECKNWKRPIDRPVIQKFIQTRDAIGAHKAAFASPSGFTEEAAQVARNNGVACWVLARDKRFIVGMKTVTLGAASIFKDLRWDLIEAGRRWLDLPDYKDKEWVDLLQQGIITIEGDHQLKLMTWIEDVAVRDGEFQISSLESGRVFDEWYLGELFNAFVKTTLSCTHDIPIADDLRQWYQRSYESLIEKGINTEDADKMLEAVLADDYGIWEEWKME